MIPLGNVLLSGKLPLHILHAATGGDQKVAPSVFVPLCCAYHLGKSVARPLLRLNGVEKSLLLGHDNMNQLCHRF